MKETKGIILIARTISVADPSLSPGRMRCCNLQYRVEAGRVTVSRPSRRTHPSMSTAGHEQQAARLA
jgi:hypothetical protein